MSTTAASGFYSIGPDVPDLLEQAPINTDGAGETSGHTANSVLAHVGRNTELYLVVIRTKLYANALTAHD